MPRRLFLESRKDDIKRAISGYFEANMEIPINWIEEYNIIQSELNQNNELLGMHINRNLFIHPNTNESE